VIITAEKKYYWLKLKEDFFRQPRMKKLRKVAGGDTYTVIYLKMQLLSLANEGMLFFEGIE
jgi:predicted phage replisome organizer